MPTAIDHIESLLVLAKSKGEWLRFPGRFNNQQPDIDSGVNYHCTELDKLGIPHSIQNQALMFINDIIKQNVWETLFRHSFRRLSERILSGEHFNLLIQQKKEIGRHYPVSCLSMMCGKTGQECNGCQHKSAKDEFNQWVTSTQAVRTDPVWNPSYYVPTK